ncbi:MAG: CRISPR-associated helicase Cas3' [Nitrospirae bacterium]|nr:CRISPR-associated helicase Cas3' [Nitrospirota bacterium]
MFKNNEYIAHYRRNDGTIQYLTTHLMEVCKRAGEFAEKVRLKEQGELIGLLHDIGKSSEEFQERIKHSNGLTNTDEDYYGSGSGIKKPDHSTAGAQLIYQTISNIKNNEFNIVSEVLSLCIASHHSGLIDCISPDGINKYLQRMDKEEKKTHISEVNEKLTDKAREKIITSLQSEEFLRNLINRFKELKTASDSKQTFSFKRGLLARFLFSCLIDADRLDTADFEAPETAKLRNHGNYKNWSVLIDRFNRKLTDFKQEGINVVRNKISQSCYEFFDRPNGLYQLTVPTGGGKTLASLRFALHHAEKHKMDRIFYVLPFTTIIDQNADEIRKILEDKNDKDCIVLEHHSNLLPENETAIQKVLSENWDAPIVLTTNVQVLEALFGSGTRGARRMHQLARSVIIFDEVQNLPIKCVHMFNTAVNFLVNNCGSTVVLCTATQPLLDKIEPKQRALTITAEQQMVPYARELFNDLKRVEVYDTTKTGGWSSDEIKELVNTQVINTGNVLVVVNTKKSARELYLQCKQFKDFETFHLSTNMCPAHRMETLNKMKSILDEKTVKKPIICISTQLIEAGVDISFGSVIRFLAGFDSIVQAAGRCNRHNEMCPSLGEVLIINPEKENLDKVHDIKIGKEKTERLLREFKENPKNFENDLLSHKAVEQYYKYYFYERKGEMNYPVNQRSSIGRDDDLFNLLSVNNLSVDEFKRTHKEQAPEIPLRQAFMSAAKSFDVIDSNTRGIVVPYGQAGKELISNLCSETKIDELYKLLKGAQRYSVNVFSNIFEKLQKQGGILEAQKGTGIYHLDERYYSDEFGLTENPVTDMDFLNV